MTALGRALGDLYAATAHAGVPGPVRPGVDWPALRRWLAHTEACEAEGLCPLCGAALDRAARCPVHGDGRTAEPQPAGPALDWPDPAGGAPW